MAGGDFPEGLGHPGSTCLCWGHRALAPLILTGCLCSESSAPSPPPPAPSHQRSVILVVITHVTLSPLRIGPPLINPMLVACGPGSGTNQTLGRCLLH